MPVKQPLRPDRLLFVYGSLRRGSRHENAQRLADESVWLGAATAQGRLYRIDWYPAFVPGESGEVRGDLVELADPTTSLPWLDRFEGCSPDDPQPHEYRRETIELVCPGSTVTASTYVWTLAINGLQPITSGDWLAVGADR